MLTDARQETHQSPFEHRHACCSRLTDFGVISHSSAAGIKPGQGLRQVPRMNRILLISEHERRHLDALYSARSGQGVSTMSLASLAAHSSARGCSN